MGLPFPSCTSGNPFPSHVNIWTKHPRTRFIFSNLFDREVSRSIALRPSDCYKALIHPSFTEWHLQTLCQIKPLWCLRAMLGSTASQPRLSGSYSSEASNSTLFVLVGSITVYAFGFLFTLVTGQTGLGKSTLINTIFASHLIDSKGRLTPSDPVRSTTEIQAVSQSRL